MTDANSVNVVYSDLSEAISEIERRRKDIDLCKRVDDLFKDHYPSFMENGPYFCLSRFIITPNNEFKRFLEMISSGPYSPNFLEYDCKLVARNPEKHSLGMLSYAENEFSRKEKVRIIDFNHTEGKVLSHIETLWGENLKDYHHGILNEKYKDYIKYINEFSSWFNIARVLHPEYYYYYLALFIKDGILFENFIADDSDEMKFFEEHVIGAFNLICKDFGVKPLIVPVLPLEKESLDYWLHQDYDVIRRARDLLETGKIKYEQFS